MQYINHENFPFDKTMSLSILTKNIIAEPISVQIGVLIHLNVKLLTSRTNILNEYYLI